MEIQLCLCWYKWMFSSEHECLCPSAESFSEGHVHQQDCNWRRHSECHMCLWSSTWQVHVIILTGEWKNLVKVVKSYPLCASQWHHFTIILICSSLQSQSIMESRDGKFIIQNVTRHMSDLICQPLWNSSNQLLQHLNATVHLTVDCESYYFTLHML